MKKIVLAPAQTDILVIVRVIVGLWIMWYGKDLFIDEWIQVRLVSWKEDLGFSNPLLMLYLAKGSEFFFGILFALGFLTRITSFILFIVLSVAWIHAQQMHIFPYDKGEITFFYWLFFFTFIFLGGGKWSLDYLLFSPKS
ncbi:DoxX family protein [Chryseobacterium sp. CT-SW4]|uniref:DoxX family protein n=1 Tax=Chryseobacterium sp. SW-1 TaxID=3157343 RepID=UPI003B02531F